MRKDEIANEQIIIFGAGECGIQALNYYGAKKVKCFVDNDPQKVGLEVCGKPIIGFCELLLVDREYSIVIASKYFSQMSEQLKNNGISDYHYYFPRYPQMISYITSRLSEEIESQIIVYGVDQYTENFLLYIMKMFETDRLYNIYKVADEKGSRYFKTRCAGYDVGSIEEITGYRNCIFIIGTEYHHYARCLELKQLMGESGIIIDPFEREAYYDTDNVVVNQYDTLTDSTEEQWNQNATNNMDIFEQINAYVKVASKKVPIFRLVEIETINRCNGVCSFCPVNKKIDPRKKTIMSRQLFDNIIEQLHNIKYDGKLSLFSNNEPLLDSRIIELSKYARESLPKARIHMFTNGTLFTLDKFKEIITYLDELIIDNYRQDLKLIKPCREIAEYVEQDTELRKKVTIVLRKPMEILTSRGGDAPNRKKLISFDKVKCTVPFWQLVIRPDGKVSLCCNDPLGRDTLGDLTKDTILDIWYGQRYEEVRKALSQGREHWDHCKYCDAFYLD